MHIFKSPETPQEHVSQYIKILGKRSTRGGPPTVHEGGGRALPPGRAPCLVGHLEAPRCPSSGIRCLLPWKKSEGSFWGEAPPSRGGTLAEPIWGSGGPVRPGKHPSERGKSSPLSSASILSSGGGQSPSTSSLAPSPLKP